MSGQSGDAHSRPVGFRMQKSRSSELDSRGAPLPSSDGDRLDLSQSASTRAVREPLSNDLVGKTQLAKREAALIRDAEQKGKGSNNG